jgi:virginiamycin B lyase
MTCVKSPLWPTITFTIAIHQPKGSLPFTPSELPGYTMQYSTWYPGAPNAGDNIDQLNGQSFTLTGLQAMYVKKLVDEGTIEATYKHVECPSGLVPKPPVPPIPPIPPMPFKGIQQVEFFTHAFTDLVIGPDGNIWTTGSGSSITKIDPTTGTILEDIFTGPYPQSICVGPDGNLWATNFFGPNFYKVTIAGVLSTYVANPALQFDHSAAGLKQITTGPDGNLWFVIGDNNIYKSDINGNVTMYPLGGSTLTMGICVGPDDNLWVTDFNSLLWQVTTAGTAMSFAVVGNPKGICTGPDGNLWINDAPTTSTGAALQVNTAGVTLNTYALPGYGSTFGAYSAAAIIVGPDGNLWASDNNSGNVWQITTGGAVTTYAIPNATNLSAFAISPDNNLFVIGGNSDFNQIQIIKINTSGIPLSRFSYFSGAGNDIVNGPDGNIWFCGYNFIANITITGVPTIYYQNTGSFFQGMCVGPDGNLWLADTSGFVWKCTTSGVTTRYSLGVSVDAFDICLGPDGNLWLCGIDGSLQGFVWQVTTGGTVTPYIISPSSFFASIISGPDGNLWVTDEFGFIFKVTTGGIAVSYTLPDYGADGMFVGPDQNIWVFGYECCPPRNWTVTTDGMVTTHFLGINSFSDPIMGSDGNVYIAYANSSTLFQIAPNLGNVVSFPMKGFPGPTVRGPDNAIWACGNYEGNIYRIT